MEVLIALAGLVGSVLEFLIGVRTPAPSAASRPEVEKRMRWRRYCPASDASGRLDSERLWDDMPGEFRLLTGNPRAIKQVLSTCGACLMGRAPAAPAAMRRACPRSVARGAFRDALAIATLAAVVGGTIALLPRVTPLAPLTGVETFLAVSMVALMGWGMRTLIRRASHRLP
ncbi:hypothetical protein [Pandoraea sputorum]|uniref:Uncharacterized protein n=1 Tax=Pandoraea sputorum TaxID=93222 RepID=A0A5E5BIP1_9BURK|nr:hypothetical protein [Pandoraea sputorum]VVE84413.1 hypothetical protein PSP31121_04750 [Pandoraea sputorum]